MAESARTAVLIAGPTASGKSALAMKLAREREGVIINADSMQVYRELRVLTARPSSEDEAEVPHRLYGHISGAEDYSAGKWLTETREVIEECWSHGKVPIIAGGTGLYFMALEEGLAQIPEIPPDIRAYWRDAEGDLHARLSKRDPLMAKQLNPADLQRIRRALEVHDATGKSLAKWQEEGAAAAVLRGAEVERHYVSVPRPELHVRCAARFDQMLEQGALSEVKALPVLDPRKPIMKAIGVRELQAHLAGALTLAQAREKAVAATRQYVKRQETWRRGRIANWTTAGS